MSLLLRKIRKSRWYRDKSWLSEKDIQADSIVDLMTKDNRLSVWFIKEDMSNLEQVIAGLAANRDFISHFDFALFSEDVLDKNSIRTEKSKGDSKDQEANDHWHCDLCELTATKLIRIAEYISSEGEFKRVQEKRIVKNIGNSVQTGKIDLDTLKKEIQVKINN